VVGAPAHAMAPMLCTAAYAQITSLEGWAAEVKYDGWRCLAAGGDGHVRLRSRQGNALTSAFPEVVAALDAVLAGRDYVVDGELVVFDDHGRPDFSMVSRRGLSGGSRVGPAQRHSPATLMVFDVLRLDGQVLRSLDYQMRRAVLAELGLEEALAGTPRAGAALVASTEDVAGLLASTYAQGHEGVVLKRLGHLYRPGQRSRDWVKVRHDTARRQGRWE
jgi:bifunctional non-homologous end joining protein LigD